MSESTKKQVGGNHYLSMGMQPLHFAMQNRWDAGAFSILKYLSRHASKNGLEDVLKARHFIDLRRDSMDYGAREIVGKTQIPMHEYIRHNGFDGTTAAALRHLESWSIQPHCSMVYPLIACVDNLAESYRGGEQKPLL